MNLIEPKLAQLISKFGLTTDKTGERINDFKFTDEIGRAFDEAGYTIRWNSKTSKFNVSPKKTAAEILATKHADDFATKDVSGRKVGFKPPRKSGL